MTRYFKSTSYAAYKWHILDHEEAYPATPHWDAGVILHAPKNHAGAHKERAEVVEADKPPGPLCKQCAAVEAQR